MNTNPKLFAIKSSAAVQRKLAFFAQDLRTVSSVMFEMISSFRWPNFIWFQPTAVPVVIATDQA